MVILVSNVKMVQDVDTIADNQGHEMTAPTRLEQLLSQNSMFSLNII